MAYELLKRLTLDANHATFYVFNPHVGYPGESEEFDMLADVTNEECERGYCAVEGAIAYFIEGDPTTYELEIYLSDAPPSGSEITRLLAHNLILEEGELAVEEAVPDETYLIQLPPNRYVIYQCQYFSEEHEADIRFSLYLVPGTIKTQGEITV